MKPHGVRGEVSVETSEMASFTPGDLLLTSRAGLTLEVETVRTHGDRLLVRFVGYPDRSTAESLRDIDLMVPGALDDPEDGWWEADLVGCDVVDLSGRQLGVMQRVELREAQDLWIVETESGEVMVPAVEALVAEVDVEGRRIVLDPPEGLFP